MSHAPLDVRAVQRAMRSSQAHAIHLDEETIATLLDHGVAGLPPEMQGRALEAIASNPQLAQMLASFDDPASDAGGRTSPLMWGIFRSVRSAWRFANAACAALATAGSWWAWSVAPSRLPQPALLDGSSPSLPSAAPGLNGLVLTLLVIAWLLVGVTFVPAFITPLRDRHSMHRGHVGE